MALASNALTTLADVKSFLGISDTSKDSALERMINSVSEDIERYCKRSFKKATYTEQYAATNTQRILLNNFPIISITSVKYNSETLTVTTDYTIESDSGALFKKDMWFKRGLSAGISDTVNYPEKNIEVVYIAGYVLPKDATGDAPRTLPYGIEDIVIEMVVEKYNNSPLGNNNLGLKQLRQGDLSYTWNEEDMLKRYSSRLDKYKRLRV